MMYKELHKAEICSFIETLAHQGFFLLVCSWKRYYVN